VPRLVKLPWSGLLVLSMTAAVTSAGESGTVNWPSFRGPGARGVSEGFVTPVRWDVPASHGVRWKTEIPGLGHSSPVIWGDRLFVTTAISGRPDPELKVGLYGDVMPVDDETIHEFRVYALDKRTGVVLWQHTAHKGVPKVKRHPKSTHANPTPATDGKHLAVFFGSEGLYLYDLDGKLLWKKDLGVLDSAFFTMPEAQWGFASSPIIHDGTVIVQADVLKGSFLAAFRLEDGQEVWRTTREDVPTWGTPTVHVDPSRAQVIVNGYRHIGGYELGTGRELWRLSGGGDIPVPTPFVAHDLIFFSGSHGGSSPLYAIRTAAEGDISLEDGATSSEHVAWSQQRGGAYLPTPLVYGDLFYVLRDNGVLSAYEARTGERRYEQRVAKGGTGYSASLVAGDGKLYLTGEPGQVAVVEAGPEYGLLATNPMGEVCMATPALSEGTLYFRTRGHVVAIGADSP
jgi:outer membrane protein assembly factor BamB